MPDKQVASTAATGFNFRLRTTRARSLAWPVLLIALFCLGGRQSAQAGVTGSISGTVTDKTGAAISGAQVVARNLETGIEQTVPSDAGGRYSFISLAPGNYDLNIQGRGFKSYQQTGIAIEVNAALRVDVTLQVGGISENIVVSSSAAHVETENTQLGEVIGSAKMTTIPLNGRSYTDLLALQPGVVPISSGQYSPTSPSGDLNAGGLSVSGGRETANGFMVNGGNVEEGTNNGTSVIPNLDSIAEFRILTSNFDAEYGNYSGGQINAVTKSGANQRHGDLFEFLRNTDLDARNFFSPTRGAFHQNQFGGTLGGPIVHSKAFYFVDYQGTRQVVGQDTGNIPVPSLEDRTGNFSDLAGAAAFETLDANGNAIPTTVVGSGWASVLSQQLGYGVTAGEPYYTSGCASSSQCVFPNATMPQSGFSAPAAALLQYIPQPNEPDGGFSTSAFNQVLRGDKFGVRLDAATRWGDLSAYYFFDDYNLNSPYPSGGATVPGFRAPTTGRTQLLNLSDTKALSGGLASNELRFSYLRNLGDFTPPQQGVGPSLGSFGFEVGASTLGIVPLAPNFEGVPSIAFNAFTIGVPNTWSTQANNTFQWLDNYSRVEGKHTLKFGVNFHYDQITVHDFGANNGSFGFQGTETGNDFVDFLIGAPSYYQQGQQQPLHSRSKYLGLYAQDSWRATSNLVLNYGLRWEFSMPWYEQNNQLETIIPGEQSVIFPGAPVGWVVPGDPGVPSTVAPTRYRNLGPRLGFAYSPGAKGRFWQALLGGAGKSSIRAGYGIYYTAIEELTNALVVGDPPFGLYWSSPQPTLFSTPFVNRADGQSQGQRFPAPLPPVNVSAENPDSTINWAQYEPISSSPGYLHTNGLPSTQQFQLSLQRQFGANTVLTVNYVGSEGRHLLVDREADPSDAALCLSLSPQCGPFSENGVYTNSSGQIINSTRVLGPAFGSDGWYANIGNSSYNALQTTLRHTSGGLELLAGYTYSKSLDMSSSLGEQVNPFQPSRSKALSAFDMTHNFVLSYSYQLPFDRLFGANRISRGWLLSGITRFTTGLPVTLMENDDQSLLGTNDTGPNGNGIDEPNYTPGPLNFSDPRKCIKDPNCAPYFNTSLFSAENLGQLGNSKRRFFYGPGINNWDMALLKSLPLSESKSLQFRFEFFNVFNHTQFNPPDGNINDGPGFFGFVTSAAPARIGQVALKFLF
jgi:Carboxypeptidase regulatory-like domain